MIQFEGAWDVVLSLQDEPEEGVGFSHKMSLKERSGMLWIEDQHYKMEND